MKETNMLSQDSQECSPLCHSGDRRFESDRERLRPRFSEGQSSVNQFHGRVIEHGVVTQLAEVSDLSSESCGFESHSRHQFVSRLNGNDFSWKHGIVAQLAEALGLEPRC